MTPCFVGIGSLAILSKTFAESAQLFLETDRTRKFAFLGIVFLLLTCSVVPGQDSNTEDKSWREFCNLTASNIAIWPNDEAAESFDPTKGDAKSFSRHASPIFEHKNPFNRDERGLVYLWKQANGTPVAIFTSLVFKKSATNRWNEVIEYHSLHDAPLAASFGGTKVSDRYAMAHQWRPSKGIQWHPLPDAPQLGESKARLHLQARSFIRRFQCEAVFPSGQTYQLKAQTTPVYKYAYKEDGQLLGGVLTFFCRATDPEAILLLAVRKNGEDKLQWQYALGNFTIGKVTFSLDKKEIWEEISEEWFNPRSHHYGGFPFRGFTIEEGIERQTSYKSEP